MAIMAQLINEEELRRLPPEEVEIIVSMVKAGGTVAEYFDSRRVNVNEIDSARFRRQIEPEVRALLAPMNLEKIKENLR